MVGQRQWTTLQSAPDFIAIAILHYQKQLYFEPIDLHGRSKQKEKWDE